MTFNKSGTKKGEWILPPFVIDNCSNCEYWGWYHCSIKPVPQTPCKDKVEVSERNIKMNNWISVEDKMPSIGDTVLIYRPDGFHKIEMTFVYNDGKSKPCWSSVYHKTEITHWQPLPTPPKNNPK